MMQNDENVVNASASAAENDDHSEKKSTEKRAASRWIEEDEKIPETPKKKSPYIQIPVIIAICIFAASLLAFFAYKYIFIAEPEDAISFSDEAPMTYAYYQAKVKSAPAKKKVPRAQTASAV